MRNEPEALLKLPKITKKATLITSEVAAPLLNEIFDKLGGLVNAVPVKKEIGCLITIEDFETLDLSEVSETVFIPGRAFVHDMEVKEALKKDLWFLDYRFLDLCRNLFNKDWKRRHQKYRPRFH